MSSVVTGIKQVASGIGDTASDIVHNPIKGVAELGAMYAGAMTGGAFGGSIARNATKNVAEGSGVAPGIMEGTKQSGLATAIMGEKKTQLPSITVQDPAAVASENARQRTAAVRQAQIDQQNSTPGRGGTILTNNYNYNT